jgi:hypothetical protein
MRSRVLGILLVFLGPMAVAQDASSPAATTPTQTKQASPQYQGSTSGPAQKPRVFITDSQSWEIEGSAGGAGGAFAAQTHGGARPQTAEIIKTFGQRCPNVIVNDKQELADYIVLLDHEGGKGALRHKDKVAVFEHSSGDVIVSHSTLSVGGSVEDACKGIESDWATHGAALVAAKEKSPPVAAAPVNSATQPESQPLQQGAMVTVESTPSGADIEVDGAFVGNTPSTVNVAPGSHQIGVKKKGFADWTRTLNVTGGSIHLNAELEAAPAPPQATALSPQ